MNDTQSEKSESSHLSTMMNNPTKVEPQTMPPMFPSLDGLSNIARIIFLTWQHLLIGFDIFMRHAPRFIWAVASLISAVSLYKVFGG